MKPVIVTNIELHFDFNRNHVDVSNITKSLIKKINKELDKIKDSQPQLLVSKDTEIKVIDLI